MSEYISPIELKERISLMGDGLYRRVISVAKQCESSDDERHQLIKNIGIEIRAKFVSACLSLSEENDYDELHNLYMQGKHIQKYILRNADYKTLNIDYLQEFLVR